jgi:hypothetical protein
MQSMIHKFMNKILAFMIIIFGYLPIGAQQDNEKFVNISFEYGVQVPFGDLSDRFGTNFQLGSHLEIIQDNTQFLLGTSFHLIFGNRVKEDVLINLRTSDGGIIGNDRQFATVSLRERGFQSQIYLGKIFQVVRGHFSSGIKSTIGLGILQHKIRVQDDSRSVTELTGDYLKGYDRLTNGLSIMAFIGYQHLDKNRRLNVLAGFDFSYAFTQNRRDFDFLSMQKDETKRVDILAGFKIGMMMPIGGGIKNPEQILY